VNGIRRASYRPLVGGKHKMVSNSLPLYPNSFFLYIQHCWYTLEKADSFVLRLHYGAHMNLWRIPLDVGEYGRSWWWALLLLLCGRDFFLGDGITQRGNVLAIIVPGCIILPRQSKDRKKEKVRPFLIFFHILFSSCLCLSCFWDDVNQWAITCIA
jgi:hypothetical protein